jgi:putative Mg2+ transporter-C (MgtC) family protein
MAGTNTNATARVLQGLITGMGFIGGGAILKNDGGVKGTATAASIWATGAVGASVAFGYLDIALIVTIITFIVLRQFTSLKSRFEQDGEAIP